MRLADFILHHKEAILKEWEAFASTLLPAASAMTSLALRDHAQAILEAVAADLGTPQTREAQSEKSKGRAPTVAGAPETAAQTHAVLRAQCGFKINQLVAEYRALRASVLRLWIDASQINEPEVEDVIRFNEAIDQAIAESVGHFYAQEERARNLLLGMLGHDMRTPLNSIVMTASYLAKLNAGESVSAAAERMIRGGASIQALLDDLVDFNRTKLGLGVKVVRSDTDLAAAVADELEQVRGAYPDGRVEFSVTGDSCGCWDGARLKQVVRNLVSNAIKYGARDKPARVALRGEQAEAVSLEVTNGGCFLDPSAVGQLFDPLKRGAPEGERRGTRGGLGLGLFIAREIVDAHGGYIEVRCDDGETTFAVRLPRHASQRV